MKSKRDKQPRERAEEISLPIQAGPTIRFARLTVAFHGLRVAWREEPGFRNHVLGALAMLTTLLVLNPSAVWWALALLCSALLLALELVNSAIERVIDHVDARIHPRIKAIKDMSAAAVIVASAGVFLLGIVMIVDTLT